MIWSDVGYINKDNITGAGAIITAPTASYVKI